MFPPGLLSRGGRLPGLCFAEANEGKKLVASLACLIAPIEATPEFNCEPQLASKWLLRI